MDGFTIHYLQQLTVRFYRNITHPTQRSVDNFGFLVGRDDIEIVLERTKVE